VRADAIDRFLASVGELMQKHARLEELHVASPISELHAEFGEELDGMERVVRELRRRALDIRTSAVRRAFERLPRVASELARALDKRVEVTLEGDEVEVDRAVLDHLDDALLHLVRNAVDHGIEMPAKRTLAGKDPIASIRLSAARVGGRLHIRIADDGSGIDVEGVRRRAVEAGMMPEAVAEDLSADRIAELLFEPGLSTKDEVSEISGRGVGLDAVKRQIEALGGSISVESTPRQGTTFDIELPLMVALQRVLILEVGGERVALPVNRVESVLDVREGTIEGVGGEAFFVWNDEPMPLLDLAVRVLARPGPERPGGRVVVIDDQGFRYGLRVDAVAADPEVFVREVPPVLRNVTPLAGVAILTDGEPVFLLEPGFLVGQSA
jgi:two-component system chemotaxis sensor kinase CheA